MSVNNSKAKECMIENGPGGGNDLSNSSQNKGINKDAFTMDLLNIQAKKACRRGKMFHVTKLLNYIYDLIETSGVLRNSLELLTHLMMHLMAL